LNLLLDTHLLIWVAEDSPRLSHKARTLVSDENNALYFSAASLHEVVIKQGLQRPDFLIDAQNLYSGLQNAGYVEVPVTSRHALEISTLPLLHKDPFDRMLIAQARCENLTLITSDDQVAAYEGSILRV
jgi:PIN domain nuclease of toxin-antitoxin system